MAAHDEFGTFIVEDASQSTMAAHIDSHDPLNSQPREFYTFKSSHTSDADWTKIAIDENAHLSIETLQGTGHFSERAEYLAKAASSASR